MSSFNLVFVGLSKSVVRHASLYREARPRIDALAPYPLVSSLAASLAHGSSIDGPSRATLVVALVEEHARAPHPLWSSLLALAFSPMLHRLRRRLRRPKDEDLDQEVLLAFLEATTRVPQSTAPHHVAICLRRTTERKVFDHMRDVLGAPITEDFDDDHEATVTLADLLDRGGAHRLEAALAEIADPAMRELIIVTCLEETPLGEYVERLYPKLSRPAQAEMAAKLRRQRTNAIAALGRSNRVERRPLVEEIA